MAESSDLTWSNWSGRETTTPTAFVRPASEDDLADALRSTTGEVRAVGATHSHSAVAASSGLVVDLEDWVGVLETGDGWARLRSGTRIHQLGAPLRAAGLALHNQGDIDRQSVAGACGTGTHGTGLGNRNFSSAVLGTRLMTADGELVETDATTDPDLWQATRLSLGAFGVATELTLSLRDAYRLHERIWLQPVDEVVADVDRLMAATRHFEFFWFPGQERAICKSLDETELAVDPMPDRPYERIGWSDRIISSDRTELHTEMEYSVPAEAGPECFAAIQRLLVDRFPDVTWPLEYRHVAADDVWLSPAKGRPTVTISVHRAHGLPDEPYYRAAEEIFLGFGGRPHWGKVHFCDGPMLREMHEDWDRWWAARDRVDPAGRFVTSSLAALRT